MRASRISTFSIVVYGKVKTVLPSPFKSYTVAPSYMPMLSVVVPGLSTQALGLDAVFPAFFLKPMEPSVEALVRRASTGEPACIASFPAGQPPLAPARATFRRQASSRRHRSSPTS